MRYLKSTTALTVLALVMTALTSLAGCGGGESNEGSGGQEEDGGIAERGAAQKAAMTFVNQDECSLMTDAFLSEAYPLGDDPLTECERDPIEGLRRGEYSVKDTTVEGDSATVVLALNFGGTLTYNLEKQDDRWLVDAANVETIRQAGLGIPLMYRDSYLLDGSPIEVRLRIAVDSFKPIEVPEYYPLEAGDVLTEMKVRIESRSSGRLDLSVSDFELVDQQGHRYPASGDPVAFDPSLGHQVATLDPGDMLTGYAGFEIPESAHPVEIRYSPPGLRQSALTWEIERQ